MHELHRKTLGGAALGLLALLLASACAAPPKIMTSHQYLSKDRSAKTLLQETGATADEEAKLFNYFLRVCNLDGAKEQKCQDTVVLENVSPRSLY